MVYGAVSRPLQRSLPLAWSAVAFVLFSMFLLGLSLLKTQVVAAWQRRRLASGVVR